MNKDALSILWYCEASRGLMKFPAIVVNSDNLNYPNLLDQFSNGIYKDKT